MSSSINNNLTIQNLPTSSGSIDFPSSRSATSSLSGSSKSQRPQFEQTTLSQRGRSVRGRGRNKLRGFPVRSLDDTVRGDQENLQSVGSHDSGNIVEDSSQSARALAGSSNPINRMRGPKPNRGGNGKYKQRQYTKQLLDGSNQLDGLDIDIVESIMPTGSETSEISSRGRHATNSRKVNLTHLLNNQYDRKQNRGGGQNFSHRNGNVGSQYRAPTHFYRDPGSVHKFSKQQFLQANCQFVVLDGHDYSVHKADPDWPVDWNCIEEVRFKQCSSTETTCPICLESPVAAKITRCGHIYCWTCMLHYLSLSDENCRNCPICFEAVYKNDLRSVVSHSFTNYSVEDEIVMRLMIRKKGCVEVEPYRSECPNSAAMQSTIENHYYSQDNLVIVDSATVIEKIVSRERGELNFKLAVDKDEPEVCFVEQALSLLNKRIERLQYKVVQSTKVGEGYFNNHERTIPTVIEESSKSYLFYQSSDGQHIYLNPFSTKALCHEYNNLEGCPLEIRAKILQMDWISMSEAWRKRFRYLEHLPLTCEFRLIEIDFENSNLISQDTYRLFENQIEQREKERDKRRREERKREKIIQVEQNRRIYGIQPSLKINLDNIDQFPSVSDERYLNLSQPKSYVNEDNFSSDSDEQEENNGQSNTVDVQPDEPVVESINEDPMEETVNILALSFREIQLQEAEAAKRAAKEVSKQQNSWVKKQGSSSTGAQSSFAQLLVNAKTSQKVWTRNAPSTSTTSSSQAAGQIAPANTFSSNVDSDGDNVELRAPPSQFTISDFMDMNVVSSTNKKKGKVKSAGKKGR